MDFNALYESVVAVGLTPVLSAGLSLVVLTGIVVLFRRVLRR